MFWAILDGEQLILPTLGRSGYISKTLHFTENFLEAWFLLSFRYSHLAGNMDDVSPDILFFSFFYLLVCFSSSGFNFFNVSCCAIPFQHEHFKNGNAPVRQCLSLKLAYVQMLCRSGAQLCTSSLCLELKAIILIFIFFFLSPLFFCVSTELRSQMFLESGRYPGNSKCCHKFTSPKNTSDSSIFILLLHLRKSRA